MELLIGASTGSAIFAFQFNQTGSFILAGISGLIATIGVIAGIHYKTGFESAKAANDELRKQVADFRADRTESDKLIADLRAELAAIPRLEGIIKLMSEESIRSDREADRRLHVGLECITGLWDAQERRAQERDVQTQRKLDLIVSGLNC
jgi:hypothetical protein